MGPRFTKNILKKNSDSHKIHNSQQYIDNGSWINYKMNPTYKFSLKKN